MKYLLSLIFLSITHGYGNPIMKVGHPAFIAAMESCENHVPQSCFDIGKMYHEQRHFNKAFHMYRKACGLRHRKACESFKKLKLDIKIKARETNRIKKVQKENILRKKSLPKSSMTSEIVTRISQDPRYQAARMSCEEGNFLSCDQLAIKYSEAGEEHNAEMIWKRACMRKHAQSCWRLAHLARKFKKNLVADKLFHKACDLGEGRACRELGIYEFYHPDHLKEKRLYNSWWNFELQLGLFKHQETDQEIAFALAWTPQILTNADWLILSPHIEVLGGKAKNDSYESFMNFAFYPMFVYRGYYLETGIGLGVVYPSELKSGLTYSFGFGYILDHDDQEQTKMKRGFNIDRLFLRYSRHEFYGGADSLMGGIAFEI